MSSIRACLRLDLLLSLGLLLGAGCNTDKPQAEPPSASAAAPKPEAPTLEAQPKAQAPQAEPVRQPSAAAVASALGGTQPVAAAVSAGSPAAGQAPAADAAGSISGPVVTGEGFAAHLQADGNYVVGKPASVKVVLKAVAPFHCNDKYPYKFTPASAAGVTFKEAVARGMNIAPSEATMDVGFTPSQAGKITLNGELSFSVCTEDRCLVEKQPLSVTFNVKEAS